VNQWWDDDANELKDNHNLNDDRVTVLEGLTGSAIPDGIKSGGIVSWESGLVFNTSYCEYVIGGVLYTSDYTQSTLSAADVTNPRFDIIVVDTSGDVTVITGTPAADPQKPVADPQTQIELTSILVAAGATVPSNVTEVLVYDEDVEWTASESGATVDFASTTNVYIGSVSTDITVIVPTDYIKFVASSPVSTAWGTLSLFLAKKVANSRGFLYVQFLLSGVRVADTQVIDLRDSNTTSYVNIAIDLLVANFTSLTMDEIRFVYNDAGASQGSRTGFYIDYIKLQDGITQPEIAGILNLYVDGVSVEPNISKLDLNGTTDEIDLTYASGGKVTASLSSTVLTNISNNTTNISNNTIAISEIDSRGNVIPSDLDEFVIENLVNGADDYLMIPHIVRNPLDGVLLTCFRIGPNHTDKEQYFFLRKSLDNGKTWTGLDGTGDKTEISTTDYGQNWTPIFTNTGRLLIFYQYATSAVATRSDSRIIYSDDYGTTWSSPYSMPVPAISNQTMPTYFFDNNTNYNDSGNLITPFWVRVSTTASTGRAVVGIAESDDDGATWDLDYSVAYDNSTGQEGELSEQMMVDCGSGIFVMISRADFSLNDDSLSVPVLMTSKDYGLTWADGTETLTPADIYAGSYLSGYAYLEGIGVTMGVPDFNVTLPSLVLLDYDGDKWLFIPYWLRKNGTDFQDLKITCINLRDFMLYGVDAIKTDGVNLPYLIKDYAYNGAGNVNGGNGSAIVLGGEILITNYNQNTATSAGDSDLNYAFISRKKIGEMVDAYNKSGFNTERITVFNATNSITDYSKTRNSEITLTGDVTTYTIENLPDESDGTIIIIQDGTGGYGIAAIASTGLTTLYIGGLAPVAANINSAASGKTVLSFKRNGTNLFVTYGSFS